jgi:hypothetical protein
MIWTILLWLAAIYIICVVLGRLFIAILMIIEGYAEHGLGGAIAAAFLNFLFNLWDLAKFAFMILIFTLIIQGCAK